MIHHFRTSCKIIRTTILQPPVRTYYQVHVYAARNVQWAPSTYSPAGVSDSNDSIIRLFCFHFRVMAILIDQKWPLGCSHFIFCCRLVIRTLKTEFIETFSLWNGNGRTKVSSWALKNQCVLYPVGCPKKKQKIIIPKVQKCENTNYTFQKFLFFWDTLMSKA